MPKRVSAGELARMTAITFGVLAIGVAIAGLAGDLGMRPARMQMSRVTLALPGTGELSRGIVLPEQFR
jgi:hypothetical protein